jgi:DNA-binding PucR family transcriptional regulator
MHFTDIDLPDFLIRRADKTALSLIPEWTRQLIPDGGQSGELSRTIRTFAECSLNVKQTARRLSVHTNTVYFRLNRINKLTGIDPRTFSGASILLTALRLLEVHASSNGPQAGDEVR